MSYKITPEQLREWASRCEARLDPTSDPAQLRAHADALEENARLRAERDTHVAVTERIKVALRIQGTGSYVEWASRCRDALDKLERAEAELAKLRQHAEAMANDLDRFAAQPDYDGQLYGPMPSIIAYRADFPEEK